MPTGKRGTQARHAQRRLPLRKFRFRIVAPPDRGRRSGRRAQPGADVGLRFLRRHRQRGRNLSPALARPHCVPQAVEELLLGVIAFPAPAMEKLDQMSTPAIGKRPPFPGSLLECRGGSPLRHGDAVRLLRESR